MNLKISVVIPLYNHALYIAEALYSVQKQTLPVFEVIVIDDGSTDDSGEIVKEIAKNDKKIRYLYQKNLGAHSAINKGIELAKGDFIAILNSDDIYHKEHFEKLTGYLEKSNADAIFSGIDFIDTNGKFIKNEWYVEARKFYLNNKDISLALINGNFLMTTSNVFVRREIFNKVGFFENLRYAHDLDFFLRLLTFGSKILYIEENLLYYRMHETNTIKEDQLKVKKEWALVVALFIIEYNEKNKITNCKDWFKKSKKIYEVLKKHELIESVIIYMQLFLTIKDRKKYFNFCKSSTELKNSY